MVRDARPSDAEAIARVHVDSWKAAYKRVFPPDALESLSVREQREVWRERLEQDAVTVLVVERGGEVCGFAAAGPSRDTAVAGELYAIYVAPRVWASGVGRQLLFEVERRLRDDGFEQGMLWVLDENPRARHFYEAAGWHQEDTRQEQVLGIEVAEVRHRKHLV